MVKLFRSFKFLAVVVLTALAGFAAFLFLKPVFTLDLYSQSQPSRSYQESVKRIDDLRRLDGADVASDGHQVFLTYGDKTPKVIVFFHGSTNSPRQFAALGKLFFDQGYNVFIPRIPHHGIKDRMTQDHARLTAQELVRLCDESVDIAHGLGDHITVVGLSLGANMTSWVAQNRTDVDHAVIIAPFWGWKGLPYSFFRPSINLLSTLPNMFLWWSKEEKMELPGPASTYYRFSTRGLGQIMRLGWVVMNEARRRAPKTKSIAVITNALDDVVNEKNIDRVADQWQSRPGVNIVRFKFDKSFGVFHDMIDPEQPYQKTGLVYPKLIELIERTE